MHYSSRPWKPSRNGVTKSQQVSIISPSHAHLNNWFQEQSSFLAGWKSFLDHLAKLDVYEVTTLEKLLDGGKLAKALGGIKPGKWTGPALEVCVAWQLRNPGETDPTGAIEEVQRRREELGIP
jgi:tRNA nucleotidyltransferase (CCA-adding enzyme)